MEVREASIEDMDQIVKLGYKALNSSWYRNVPPDERKFRKLVLLVMSSSQHIALVAVRKGKVVGMLLGVTDQIFFSTKKSATDIITYVDSKGAGSGRSLVKHFVEWAKAKPDVYQIVLSVSAGMVNTDKASSIYTRAGLQPAGGSYSWYRNV